MDESPPKVVTDIQAILGRDAVLVLALSVSSYIFSYSYRTSYLASFGVDSSFTSIDSSSLVASAIALLSLLMIAFGGLQVIPHKFLSKAPLVLVAFQANIMISAAAIFLYYGAGVTWVTIIVGSFAAYANIFDAISLAKTLRSGGSFIDFILREVQHNIEFHSNFFLDKVAKGLGGRAFLLAVAIVFGPHLFGTLIGSWSAATQHDFMTYSDGTSKYIVISSYGGGMISAEISASPDQLDTFNLTGNVNWVGPVKMQQETFTRLTNIFVKAPVDARFSRTSLDAFLAGVKQHFTK